METAYVDDFRDGRRLTAPVLLAILTVPAIFVWLLLLPRYPSSLRIAGFTYAGTLFAIGMIGAMVGTG